MKEIEGTHQPSDLSATVEKRTVECERRQGRSFGARAQKPGKEVSKLAKMKHMKTNEANCLPCAPCSTESLIDTRSVLDFCCEPSREGSGYLFGMQVRAFYVRLLRQLTSNRDNSLANGVAVVTSMWLQFVCLLMVGVY